MASVTSATLVITIEELYAQFKIRWDLEQKVKELESKLAAVESAAPKKTARKPKEPKVEIVKPVETKETAVVADGVVPEVKAVSPGKKPKLSPEELSEVRRKAGLKAAATKKAKKEAELLAKQKEELEAAAAANILQNISEESSEESSEETGPLDSEPESEESEESEGSEESSE